MIDALNAAAAVASLALALIFAGGVDLSVAADEGETSTEASAVEDATGVVVPADRYGRIVSATTIGDQVLDAILEPERLIAVTAESRRSSETPWRHEGRAAIDDLADLESLVAMDPDLVVVSNVAEARRVARLREAGLRVFDIGGDAGVEALAEATRRLGRLVRAPERAEALVDRFETRMDAIADGSERASGLYVGAWGNQLFGGAAGTGYHDVLEAAGLRDIAAEAGYEGWPSYSVEQLVELDPQWLVVPVSTAETLCERETLAALRACREENVAAIDDAILGDPGYGMLPAAEALHRRVFGRE